MSIDYDLVLKGGEVIDPSQGLRAIQDVAFKDGKMAAVSEMLDPERGAEVVDVSGKMVLPGLIDLHGHFAHRMEPYAADPEGANLPYGVTTAVDAGSTGWVNFPAFRSYVMERVDTRLLAFIHLSALGVSSLQAIDIPDLEEFRLARVEETVKCITDNRDVALGVKVRLSPDGTTMKNAVPALKMARDIADGSGSRVMVHVMESLLPMGEVFQYLKAGDIITHCFQGKTHSLLDERGGVREEVWIAYRNGMIFDTASFLRHFSIQVCRVAIGEGLLPHTISTDRTGTGSCVPEKYRPTWMTGMRDQTLLDHMSMFMALGMSLEEVVRSVTVNAASVIGRMDLGSLRPGAAGDVAVLGLEEGDFGYEDGLGNEVRTDVRFAPVLTVRGGRRWHPR